MERDSKASAGRLAEVWNDTVDLRHLCLLYTSRCV